MYVTINISDDMKKPFRTKRLDTVCISSSKINNNIEAISVSNHLCLYWVVINARNSEESAFVKVDSEVLGDSEFFILIDDLNDDIYIRSREEILKNGLFVSLKPYETYVFRVIDISKELGLELKRVIGDNKAYKGYFKDKLNYIDDKELVKQTDDFLNLEKLVSAHIDSKEDESIIQIFTITDQNKKQLFVHRTDFDLPEDPSSTPEFKNNTIVYVSMEMFIQELLNNRKNQEDTRAVDANFSGGLGILAGCTMEGLNDKDLNVCAVLPLYSKRRLQTINEKCEQVFEYEDVNYNDYPNMEKIIGIDGKSQLEFSIKIAEEKRTVKVWRIFKGKIPIYLLECKEVFDLLYIGDRERRLIQELLFGEIVPHVLKFMNIKPGILHLNESHPVMSVIKIKDWEDKYKEDDFFKDTKVVFTLHTPRTAGMETFYVPFKKLEIDQRYKPFFDHYNQDKQEFTHAAMELASIVNTVSLNQVRIAKTRLFRDKDYSNKIIGIMNGSSNRYWMSEALKTKLDDIEKVSPIDLWHIHQHDKENINREFKHMMIAMKIYKKLNLRHCKLHARQPVVWLVRRIVEYKSQWPILKDIIEVICSRRDKIVDTKFGKLKGLGMQVVLGGVAHPDDLGSQEWIKEFNMWMKGFVRSDFKNEYRFVQDLVGNFFFLPTGRFGLSHILKMSAIGCDLLLEIPKPDEEACGTSGMRAMGNANPTINSSDGALVWLKDAVNGFSLKRHDSLALYQELTKCSDMYYRLVNNEHNNQYDLENDKWLHMRKQALITWREKLDIKHMVEKYIEEVYYTVLKMQDS